LKNQKSRKIGQKLIITVFAAHNGAADMKKAVPVEDTANREGEKITLHTGTQADIPVFLSGVMILTCRSTVIRSQFINKLRYHPHYPVQERQL